MKKTIGKFVAALLCCTLLAGCSGNGQPSASLTPNVSTQPSDGTTGGNEAPVTVSILQYKVEIVDQLNAAIQAYKAVKPNVTIQLETVGGGDDIGPTLKAKLQAGQLPTIYNIGGPSDVEIYQDYLEDLSDQPWVETANEGVLAGASRDGKVYGMPYAIEALGLVYNREIFEDAGVDVSTMNSFEGMEAAFKKVQEGIDNGSLKEKYPALEAVVEVPGAEMWVWGDHASNVALAPEYNYDAYEAYQSKRPEWKYGDAYKDYIDLQLRYSKWADNGAGSLSVDYATSVEGGLALERVACIQQGNWIYNQVATIDGEVANKLDFAPIPIKGVKEDSIFTLIPMYWCINSQAGEAEKTAAKEFLNWLYQSEEGKDIVVNQFHFIPAFSNYGDLYPGDSLAQSIKKYVEEDKTMSVVFKGTPDGWATNVMGARVQGYLQGNLSWEDVLKQAADEWEKSRTKSGS